MERLDNFTLLAALDQVLQQLLKRFVSIRQ